MHALRSPPRNQAAYCCEQDHGEPSRSPPRHDSGLPPSKAAHADVSEARSFSPSSSLSTSSNSLLLDGRLQPAAGGERTAPTSVSSSSASSCPPPAGACSDAGCTVVGPGPGAVFECCGLPVARGCRPISPLTGCEDADGCLECPDCRSPHDPCFDPSAACDLAECELGAVVECTSPECAVSPACFDEDCDEECGAVECEVEHHVCVPDGGTLASSDVLDCCGHEHSWACEEAPPLFGDFDQLLDCCPPQFLELSTAAPAGPTAITRSGTGTPNSSFFPPPAPAVAPSAEQTPLASFQALIDAAIANQSAVGSSTAHSAQPSPAHSASVADLSHHMSGHPYAHPTSPFTTAFPAATQPTPPASRVNEVPCLWSGCDEVFPNVDLLLDHFRSTASHLPVASQPGFDQDFAAHFQSQQLYAAAAEQAQAQSQAQQASADAKTTQEILDFLNQNPPQPQAQPLPTFAPNPLAPQPPASDPFSLQCQWGANPHTFTLADLAPGQNASQPDATLSPTNLFLKHLMEEHLSGAMGTGAHSHGAATSPVVGDDAASILSVNGLAPTDWSTPPSYSSNAGTPTSLDGSFSSALHPPHPHHHHPATAYHHHHHGAHHFSPHQHLYVPQQSSAHLSPLAHSHPHPHQHQHQHQHLADCFPQHHCSIEPPSSAGATRPPATQARSIARHHPYRAPSEAPSAAGPHHAHVHHAHGHHVHTHLHGRHLLPSVKNLPSTRSSISSAGAGHGHDHAEGSAQGDGPHVCGYPNCGLVFDDTATLTEHLDKAHVGSGKNQYTCGWDGCDRALHGPVFKSKQKIMRHLQSHTGHKPFVCQICSQTFSEAATLQQHVRRHSKDKPHICDHDGCAKAFPLASSLAIHKRTHDDVKPFQCPHCARCFTEASNLNKHVRTHTGEKPFECRYPGCSKRFARPDQLSRHQGVHTRKEERERLAAAGAGVGASGSAGGDGGAMLGSSSDSQDESS